MAKIEEFFIVGKGRDWLISNRPDVLRLPNAHIWSQHIYDAKRFENRRDARKKAREVGGKIWLFCPATGKKSEVTVTLPEGAVCDTCRGYTPYDGICRKPESEYYREPVSYMGVCEEWEEKDRGRAGREDPAASAGCGKVEKPGG